MLRVLLFCALACHGATVCEPAARQVDAADAVPVVDLADFPRNIATFARLRAEHPDNVFVHERYQDAVRRHGIEGHLKALAEEYQLLATEHPGEIMYRYLAARALIGHGTPSAVQSLTAIAHEFPDFAPAQCTLDRLPALVLPLPEPSPLLDRAEQFLLDNADPRQILTMAAAAIRADEWRLQRIRALDWYAVDIKRAALREMQAEYWRFWELEVHCFRRSGQFEKAGELLASMEQRARALADPERVAQVERLRASEPAPVGTTALPWN
jgi:hypothetical protein